MSTRHFTSARLRRLELYLADAPLAFDLDAYQALRRRWRGQADRAFAHRDARGFGPGGRQRQRADYDALRDLATVAGRVWLARAWRMVEQEGLCLERGSIATWDVGCHYDDPEDFRRRADIALETAASVTPISRPRPWPTVGWRWLRAVTSARGMDRLDEAMALATSGYSERFTSGLAVCSFFVACWCIGDLARLESWCEPLRQRGLIGERGFPVLTTHYDAVYGTLLCNVGRIAEAESVLTRLEQARESGGNHRARRSWALAKLRMGQGRLNEAEQLLLGLDDCIEALIPMARLHLARGDCELAAGAARRMRGGVGAARKRGG